MPNYLVTMPVETGFVSKEVEAVDEAAAIEAFWTSGTSPSDADAWQFEEHVVPAEDRGRAPRGGVRVRQIGNGGPLVAPAPITIRVGPWGGERGRSGVETLLETLGS